MHLMYRRRNVRKHTLTILTLGPGFLPDFCLPAKLAVLSSAESCHELVWVLECFYGFMRAFAYLLNTHDKGPYNGYPLQR